MTDNFPRRNLILRALRSYRGNRSISSFMPCMAKAIYDKYMDEPGKVFDFCGGYGGRLTGAFASPKVISYVGSDPCFKTWSGLSDLARHLRLRCGMSKPTNVINQDSLETMKQFSDNAFDFCFTSPPYFDAEEYSEEQSQSFNKFPSYGAWLESFLFPSIIECTRICKKVAINIANTGPYLIADDLRKMLIGNNLLIEEHGLRYPSRTKKHKVEPLFIIRRK